MARKATARKTSSSAKRKRASSRTAAAARKGTSRKSVTRVARPPATRSTRRRGASDALGLLKNDHTMVKKLFSQFEKQHRKMDAADKAELVNQICHELKIHAQIEEEIFYPRIRSDVSGTEELLDEAQVEHQSAKDLIAAIESGSPDDGIYDAQVSVLGEYVKHHVKEEEGELFPKVKRDRRVDLAELGEELTQRKMQLQ